MTIDFTTSLSAAELASIRAAGATVSDYVTGKKLAAKLSDALAIGDALLAGSTEAMKAARTNQPAGRPYAAAFAAWKKTFGFETTPTGERVPKAFLDDCIIVARNRDIANTIVNSLDTNQRIAIGISGLAKRTRLQVHAARQAQERAAAAARAAAQVTEEKAAATARAAAAFSATATPVTSAPPSGRLGANPPPEAVLADKGDALVVCGENQKAYHTLARANVLLTVVEMFFEEKSKTALDEDEAETTAYVLAELDAAGLALFKARQSIRDAQEHLFEAARYGAFVIRTAGEAWITS